MGRTEPLTILTIGHSTHEYESFLMLLRRAGVTAIADVRTSPFSRHLPHFNRDTLRDDLRQDGISYVFLGKELGGRPSDHRFYCDGVADYEKMATSDEFRKGLDRVIDGAKKYRMMLMCSEHDPLDCHRFLLVGRALSKRGITVKHVLSDGRIATHPEIEERLLEKAGRETDDLFVSREERLSVAYRDRARKVAFTEPQPDPQGTHCGGDNELTKVNLSTIGFTKTTAEGFFERLLNAGVTKVIDVRLRNTSQLAGFAKADDLAYFLKRLAGIQYVHKPLLAPTDTMLKAYKKEKGDWSVYEERFLALMVERQIEKRLVPEMLDGACLLCSEATPHHCHRRLVCEYLNDKWNGTLAVHHL